MERKSVEWVGPAILVTANEALEAAGWLLLAHSLPAAIAAIALAAVTTPTDVEKRVARRVNAPPHAKAFDGSICCHHVKLIFYSLRWKFAVTD
jgi:hypothetical protein